MGYLPHVLSTSVFYTAGLAVGVLVGFLIGLALGQSSRLLRMLEPLLEFIRALPPLLFIPVLLLFVKTPYIAEIIAVATTAGLTIAVYVLSALPNIPQNYLALARLLGAKATTRIWHIQIPSIMPGLVGALRVASALSLGVAVVIEYLAVPKGIGRVIKYAMSFSDLGLIWTGITWVVIIALFIDFIILKSSHFGLRWSTRADQPLALHSGEVV